VTGRAYDVVLFGASGFTGKLTAEYLARQALREPFRLALAGRSRKRLEAVGRVLATVSRAGAEAGLIEADVGDPSSLRAMARQGQVLISTVGPYLTYGEPVVRACIAERTDYVDLTGEPEFVQGLVERCDAEARRAGVRIVNSCGFDSIPHDLGVLFTVEELRRRLPEEGRGATPIRIEGFVRAKGSFSGGTWHSLVQALARHRQGARASRARRSGRSEPTGGRRVWAGPGGLHHRKELGAWAVPMPTIDPQVVGRSAHALTDYGSDFQYRHHLLVRRLGALVAGAAFLGGVFAMAQARPTRALLLKIRDPGQGPSEEQRRKSWFQVVFLGEAGGQRVRCEVRGGDPGYGETSKMLAESALCLALDRESLPPSAGVVTPAVAMGRRLVERLQAAGIEFRLTSAETVP
jgi:short subunit dehydrogenase-like uncharacterized protein